MLQNLWHFKETFENATKSPYNAWKFLKISRKTFYDVRDISESLVDPLKSQ
jgi:ACT domain-containing protein